MKYKIFIWLFIISVMFVIDNYLFQVELPTYATDEALQQMNDRAIYSNGFTLVDSFKTGWFFIFTFVWTMYMFTDDILEMIQRLNHKGSVERESD